MDLGKLQVEVNHLLFLYFTSIGSIQRDAGEADIENRMGELIEEIKKCKSRIDALLAENVSKEVLPDDFYEVIENGKVFVDDGLYFINKIVDL
ncbi:hypothetical protein PAEPH01_1019 [Pancytospora epiphaga]|nr:hypothetical protein PAEPH01_1019 [Pancytospora epiphaga]